MQFITFGNILTQKCIVEEKHTKKTYKNILKSLEKKIGYQKMIAYFLYKYDFIYLTRINSTLRFLTLPSAVLFESIGLVIPYPSEESRSALIPLAIK